MKMSDDKRFSRNRWLGLLAAIGLTSAAHAYAEGPAQLADAASAGLRGSQNATLGVEQRLREELRAVMTELIQTGAFGDEPPQQIAIAVDSPAQRVSNLGLLVDSTGRSRDGLHVLGVTPGSGAEHMGLRAGDVLVAMNGTSLTGNDAAAATLRQAVDEQSNGGTLSFDLRRDGHSQSVSGSVSSVYLPAMRLTVGNGVAVASTAGGVPSPADPSPGNGEGCGRISDFDVAPRQQQLHGAKIISIDGVTPGPSGSKSFRVNAGRHVLKVAERIESRYLSFNDIQRNSGTTQDQYKILDVDVAPDTTTLIAARLNDDKRDVWQHGAYWDPVAWKQTPESCR